MKFKLLQIEKHFFNSSNLVVNFDFSFLLLVSFQIYDISRGGKEGDFSPRSVTKGCVSTVIHINKFIHEVPLVYLFIFEL